MNKVLISGGGTGGHVFPAIAIANALKNKIKDIDILFVGAKGRLEEKKVPEAGYKIITLWISGFQRRITLKNLMFPIKLISSLIKAGKILKDFKPDVVVGVGGYASGPVLRKAIKMHIPALIQEQNSFPGITNRILAEKVNKICVAYEGMEKFFPENKIYVTGNPIRQDISDLENKRKEALQYFDLSADRKTVLVIGGSLGARTINESIDNSINLFAENNIQLIWQTGKIYYDQAKSGIANKQLNKNGIRLFAFIDRMDYAYAAADIIVSRAGAIAISELCAVKKPAILIPSPNVAEDHQTKNALALANKNAAVMIKDSEALEKSGITVIELINNIDKQKELCNNIKSFYQANSADRIADEIIDLIKK